MVGYFFDLKRCSPKYRSSLGKACPKDHKQLRSKLLSLRVLGFKIENLHLGCLDFWTWLSKIQALLLQQKAKSKGYSLMVVDMCSIMFMAIFLRSLTNMCPPFDQLVEVLMASFGMFTLCLKLIIIVLGLFVGLAASKFSGLA